MALYTYQRWDGSQAIEPFTAGDLMDHLADKILDDGDLRSAMREMLQRGARFQSGRRMYGLRDLLERLRQRREQQLQRYNLGSVMDDIKEKLEQVVQTERDGIQRRLNESQAGTDEQLRKMLENMARKHLDQLDALPPETGGRIQSLRQYEFMDQDARRQFDELMDTLRKQILDSYFQGLKQSIGAMTPEMLGQVQQMVKDLNRLLEQHRRGDDSGFRQFMDKWGHFFPEGIENVD
ncbi:MAG: VWA domain-containing protein, partial [Chloroflexota bacterium]|nr:VWA domain-containing protein [Chloroflexota bacterium]